MASKKSRCTLQIIPIQNILASTCRDERGWLIPKLPALETMVKMYMKAYGTTHKQPPQRISLQKTCDILLPHMQSSSLKDLIDPGKENSHVLLMKRYHTFGLGRCRSGLMKRGWPRLCIASIAQRRPQI